MRIYNQTMKLKKLNKKIAYQTSLGVVYNCDSLEYLREMKSNSIQLVMTSPPFALSRPKEYSNKPEQEYIEWFKEFALEIKRVLKPNGSFVIDLGGSYKKGRPVRSLYNYELLILLVNELGFNLAEEFFWHNPSKLPSPIEWVNKRKIRVKDSVNTIWWLSKSDFPYTNMKAVLTPYSERMQKLLKDPEKYYQTAERPSGHQISKGFAKDNGGSIPSNLLVFPNSDSSSSYLKHCKVFGLKSHPARFPIKLPDFFIRFLSKKNDIILDIFSGSNTTGEASETLGRKWISIEQDTNYALTSLVRFIDSKNLSVNSIYKDHPVVNKIIDVESNFVK